MGEGGASAGTTFFGGLTSFQRGPEKSSLPQVKGWRLEQGGTLRFSKRLSE